jgi:arsenical pump membrane protein
MGLEAIGALPVAGLAAGLGALGGVALAAAPTPWLFLAALVLQGLAHGSIWTAVSSAVMFGVADPRHRGTAASVNSTFKFGGGAIAPALYTPAYGAGPSAVFALAAAGALALAAPRLRRSPRRVGPLLLETNPPFLAFVLALAVVVLAVRQQGLDRLVAHVTPHATGYVALLGVAVLAALLANLLNNLPATLVLLPAVAHVPGLVLAVLVGVNVGPNLTYVGSLATLLWRQILHARDAAPVAGEFLRLGLLTVPACLVAGVAALWVGLTLWGPS